MRHRFQAHLVNGPFEDPGLFVDSQFVSRHHAQLTVSEAGCALEDLNSTNGVLVNEKPVTKLLLENGDIISLGTHELIYSDMRNDDAIVEDTAANERQG